MAKRKRSSATDVTIRPHSTTTDIPLKSGHSGAVQRASRRQSQPKPAKIDANPDANSRVVDGQEALRASPDEHSESEKFREDKIAGQRTKEDKTTPATPKVVKRKESSDSSLSELSDVLEVPVSHSKTKTNTAGIPPSFLDPEADADGLDADPEELSAALSRPPPVNSSYLPLPWKGRLGYACLNTYLRNSNPPVFSSRTCRIASILENRHPLKDPSQPAHATKNRPDREQPADIKRGQAFVEGLGLANARDIPRMLRWNDKYGIKFLRLSSEMFPFASHDVYGYKLAPFASEALADAGRVAAELGHRLTTHPGQFTQLGSPRKEVIDAAVRDLDYHAELLSLLKLPDQLNRDAVMILHMGGIFGDKAATLDRFRRNYAKLDQNIKNRLVLENDDVCYSVHDLLPLCEELNIPFVLDFHHHNIIFDKDQIREGTLDIMDLYPRIKATWTRKGITQKMHYSEPTPGAITGSQRRKHNSRVATLPPCAPDMDLMIEAKDKEQAVFELMRTFKLPGFDSFNDITPYTRDDENRPWKPPAKKKTPKKSKKAQEGNEGMLAEEECEPQPPAIVPDEEMGMGGPLGRVYWPVGMEEWLRPKKREIKKKPDKDATPAKNKKAAVKSAAEEASNEPMVKEEEATGKSSSQKAKAKAKATSAKTASVAPPPTRKKAPPAKKAKKATNSVPTPSTSDVEDDDDAPDVDMPDLSDASAATPAPPPPPPLAAQSRKGKAVPAASGRRQNGRAAKKAVMNYAEHDGGSD
ncbi:UV-damage endonuclease [Endocarpon pusillum]|uniref:UV-damage endonuclease n=1 Tax=Endocarpon pusillum TaxID=364733 RepID=A0A8H7E6U5_9EURO|nr:UV-damage endonuclease [Endocarpon pusillum]